MVGYPRLAAEEALAALNPDEGVRWYSTALDALGTDAADVTRAQVLSRLGDARRQTGDLTYRETLLEAARLALEFDDVDTLVFAALANSRQIQSTTGSIDQERVDVIEAAIDRVGSEDTPERAMLLAHLAVDRSYDGEPDRRSLLVEEALAIARRVGDPATLFDVLLRRIGIWMPADIEQRLAESAEALAIAEALDDPVARFWALFYRSIVAAEAGDRALLDECRSRFPEEARVTGQPMLAWVTSYAQGWQRILEGDLEGAEQQANQALELGGATGQPDAMPIYGGQLVDLRWHQGRDTELVELIEQMVESTPDIDSFRSALARIYADIGRTEDARALLSGSRPSTSPTRSIRWPPPRSSCGPRWPSRRVTPPARRSWSPGWLPSPIRWCATGWTSSAPWITTGGRCWRCWAGSTRPKRCWTGEPGSMRRWAHRSSKLGPSSSWPACSSPATAKATPPRRSAVPDRHWQPPASTDMPPSSVGPQRW